MFMECFLCTTSLEQASRRHEVLNTRCIQIVLSIHYRNLTPSYLQPVFKPFSSQFEYPGSDVVQMRFLRLGSRFCSQRVSYSCGPGGRQGSRERQVKFLADTRRQSYLAALSDCEVSERVR